MADRDRLSDLPNDLLQRILHFAPAKEGTSTSVLARRWRFIWRSSGAVNLDSRSCYDHLHRFRRRLATTRDAHEALAAAAAHGRVTRFTFRYEEGEDDIDRSCSHDCDILEAKDVMAHKLQVLLCSPATRHVEELRLGLFYGVDNDSPTWLYGLSIRAMSCSPSLRVLHVSKCMDIEWWDSPPTPAGPFPRLVELRLHVCSVSLSILQRVIDAAPQLATLYLNGVKLEVLPDPTYGTPRSLHLCCPKITHLVLANLYCWGPERQNTMEVQAPLLRHFSYEGPIRSLSLKPSPPPDMARVDLRFHVPAQVHKTDGTCQRFWKLIRNLSCVSNINLNFQLSENACRGDSCC